MKDIRKIKLINILKIMGIKSISDIKPKSEEDSNDFILEDKFELRLKIQKLIFFLKKIDKDLDYPYSMYIHGPYSPQLADDYFSITDDEINNVENNLDENEIKMVEYLNNKDPLWLEIASTLKFLIDMNYNDEEAINKVIVLKNDILNANNKDSQYIKQILQEIKEIG